MLKKNPTVVFKSIKFATLNLMGKQTKQKIGKCRTNNLNYCENTAEKSDHVAL